MSDDCLFCKIIAGELPSKKAYEDEHVVAFHDINPGAPTHVLICPREHIATLNDLGEDHTDLVGRIFLAAQKIAEQEGISEKGYRTVFNCGAGAGQSVFHIHLHVLGGRPMKWPPC